MNISSLCSLQVVREYDSVGIQVLLANPPTPLCEALNRYGFFQRFSSERLFPSVAVAVKYTRDGNRVVSLDATLLLVLFTCKFSPRVMIQPLTCGNFSRHAIYNYAITEESLPGDEATSSSTLQALPPLSLPFIFPSLSLFSFIFHSLSPSVPLLPFSSFLLSLI